MNDRAVKNSVHIRPLVTSKVIRRLPLTSADIHAFATGYGAEEMAGPVQIAWLLENTALARGWPIGESLGSESDFIERFSSSRDVIRGAIRIVEARGLMRIRRGCKGGLRLLRPDPDHAAGTFATYLHASGYSASQLELANEALKPLWCDFPTGAVVWELWDRIAELLTGSMALGTADGTRAEIVAMQLLLKVGTSIPEEGALLGCEADICEEYNLGHRTFRQTLRILDDLGMLQVKRGRGGGYLLTRPAPIGVIRRIFALLASRGLQAADAEQVIWALNIANLRLVFRRLESLSDDQRAKWCDDLAASLAGLKEMRRWMTFHKGLSAFADNLLLGTMNSSMHAYLGRVGPLPGFDQFDSRLVEIEQAIREELRQGSAEEAEGYLRTAQKFISSKSQNS